ncbi:MAG: peptide chain release factor 1, partial [Desulfomonilaceae bacterium]
VGLTLYKLDAIMDGRLDDVIDPLIVFFQAEALKSSSQN